MALNQPNEPESRPATPPAVADDQRLGCGRTIDQVWQRLDREPDEHEAGCDFCRDARSSLTRLAGVIEEFRADELSSGASGRADVMPGSRVKDAVMQVARAEVRRGRRLQVRTDPGGSIEISEQTLSALIRFACDSVPGVRSRRCQAAQQDDVLNVAVRLAIRSGESAPALADLVRARITAVVPARAGLSVGRIDLIIEDVYDA